MHRIKSNLVLITNLGRPNKLNHTLAITIGDFLCYMINASPTTVKHLLRILKDDTKRTVSKLTVSKVSDRTYCYDTLNEVSRSFAMVIQDLPMDVKDAICVFYLMLRALDTIEDDMQLDEETKFTLLRSFHETCGDESFALDNIGDREVYVNLLRNYPRVNRVYNSLDAGYQLVIKEICHEMAQGMLIFANKTVETKEDYIEYCHYVAGTVGQGLSKIFVASGLESKAYLDKMDLSNDMGLFLQKTNITRDFFEDIDEGRIFWPTEIWENYTQDLNQLKTNYKAPKSLACLNKMVENALAHFGDSIKYLEGLENQKIFRFCAIPQVMAIGTLSKVFNNPDTLVSNVKMSKSDTMDVFANLNTIQDFAKFSLQFINDFKLHETDVATEVILNQYKQRLSKYL